LFFGVAVATTIAKGIVSPDDITVYMIIGGLAGAITVATEFAESLNPLTKSKISAMPIATIANSNIRKPRHISKRCLQLHQQHLHIYQRQFQ